MYQLLPVLKKLRTRPGMYIGEPSLTKLAGFLHGYDYAIYELRSEAADPFFLGFQNWIEQRLQTPHLGWDNAILRQCHSEAEAFDRFWELFDEYAAQIGDAAEPCINGSVNSSVATKQESRP